MKFWFLSVTLHRAARRSGRGERWLLRACLLCCCGLMLYAILAPFVENRHSIYANLTSLSTDIQLRASVSYDNLSEALSVLETSAVTDYYLLESKLDETAAGRLSSLSTVVTTRHSLYAMQPSAYLCDSADGAPLDGYAYINSLHESAGYLSVSYGSTFTADGQPYLYQISIWGDDRFDMLVSNHDFFAHNRPIRRIVYGISPLASRSAVKRLNDRLGALLPDARFTVAMDKTLGVKGSAFLTKGGPLLPLVVVCLLTYYLLFDYRLERRMRDLSVARLVGCRRGQLLLLLAGESARNALTALLAEMAVFSVYRLLFAGEAPRTMLLLWKDALPVIVGLPLFAALLGLLAGGRWLCRSPLVMNREVGS